MLAFRHYVECVGMNRYTIIFMQEVFWSHFFRKWSFSFILLRNFSARGSVDCVNRNGTWLLFTLSFLHVHMCILCIRITLYVNSKLKMQLEIWEVLQWKRLELLFLIDVNKREGDLGDWSSKPTKSGSPFRKPKNYTSERISSIILIFINFLFKSAIYVYTGLSSNRICCMLNRSLVIHVCTWIFLLHPIRSSL